MKSRLLGAASGRAALPPRARDDRMRGRREILDRHASRELAGQMKRAPRRVAVVRVRRPDETIFLAHLRLRLRRVARADHRGIDELVDAVRRHEQLGVCHFDGDGVARHHVRDVHREHVGAVLLEQRRALAFALRGFELLLRLRSLADGGNETRVADRHRQAVDGGARRGREHVAGVQRPLSAPQVQSTNA